jgi:hypothetical protein
LGRQRQQGKGGEERGTHLQRQEGRRGRRKEGRTREMTMKRRRKRRRKTKRKRKRERKRKRKKRKKRKRGIQASPHTDKSPHLHPASKIQRGLTVSPILLSSQ